MKKTVEKHDVDKLRRRLRFWWFMMGFSVVISMTLNLWHSLLMEFDPKLIQDACAVSADLCAEASKLAKEVAGTHWVLGLIFAIVPPGMAFGLSDALVDSLVIIWIKVAIIILLLVVMVTSIVSQASVLHPYGGGYHAEWTVPVAADAVALIALHMIVKIKALRREAIEEADMEADKAALRKIVEADIRPDIEADIRRTYEADIAAAREDIEADIRRTYEADMARTLSAREADMEEDMTRTLSARMAELEASFDERLAAREEQIRGELEVDIAGRIRRELSSAKGSKSKPPPKAEAASTKGGKPEACKDDLLVLIKREPGLTEREQATSLGVSDRTVRRWKNSLVSEGLIKADMSAPVVPLRVAQ